MWPFSWFQNSKDLLLQNEKLMWVQEEKVKILVAIHSSLPVIAKEAALLLGVKSSQTGCCNHHWGDHQLLRGTWDLHWRNNSSRSLDLRGSGTTTLPRCPPDCVTQLPHSQWLGLSIWYWDGQQLLQWLWEGASKVYPPTLGFSGHEPEPLTDGNIQGTWSQW